MSQARNFADLLASGTKLTSNKLDDNAIHGNRNLIINGAMQVAQRGDVTGITTANLYGGADRFATNGSGFGTVSLVQEADAPEGFAKSQRVKFTTARSTTAASDHFIIGTRLEGQDLQRFKKGTSNAEFMTVSFYAKASQATTVQLELYDNDNNRHASKEFAITTSWARYSYSFAGDTTGSFDNDNNVSLYVLFWLGAGTDFTSGTNPNGSWLALDQTRRVHSDVGTTFMDTLNAEFNLTGVQLEVGSVTPFEHRSYGDELARCQRYFAELPCFSGPGTGTTDTRGYGSHVVQMRAAPTLGLTGVMNITDGYSYDRTQSSASISLITNTADFSFFNLPNFSSITGGRIHFGPRNQNANRVTLDAEL